MGTRIHMHLCVRKPQPKYQQFDGCQNQHFSALPPISLLLSHRGCRSRSSVNGVELSLGEKKTIHHSTSKAKGCAVASPVELAIVVRHLAQAQLMRFFALMCTAQRTHRANALWYFLFDVVIFNVVCVSI